MNSEVNSIVKLVCDQPHFSTVALQCFPNPFSVRRGMLYYIILDEPNVWEITCMPPTWVTVVPKIVSGNKHGLKPNVNL